jgi:hypothetical protein
MSLRIVSPEQFQTTPWKNGGGVTHEIARVEQGGRMVWRLSVAEVDADGPFSRFDGMMRILTVIEGAGLELVTPDGVIAAKPRAPVRFSGDPRLRGIHDGLHDLGTKAPELAEEAASAIWIQTAGRHLAQIVPGAEYGRCTSQDDGLDPAVRSKRVYRITQADEEGLGEAVPALRTVERQKRNAAVVFTKQNRFVGRVACKIVHFSGGHEIRPVLWCLSV